MLIKRGSLDTNMHTGKRHVTVRAGTGGYVSTRQGTPKNVSKPPETRREAWSCLSLLASERTHLLTPWAQISGLQSSEIITFCCFSNSLCGTLLHSPSKLTRLGNPAPGFTLFARCVTGNWVRGSLGYTCPGCSSRSVSSPEELPTQPHSICGGCVCVRVCSMCVVWYVICGVYVMCIVYSMWWVVGVCYVVCVYGRWCVVWCGVVWGACVVCGVVDSMWCVVYGLCCVECTWYVCGIWCVWYRCVVCAYMLWCVWFGVGYVVLCDVWGICGVVCMWDVFVYMMAYVVQCGVMCDMGWGGVLCVSGQEREQGRGPCSQGKLRDKRLPSDPLSTLPAFPPEPSRLLLSHWPRAEN